MTPPKVHAVLQTASGPIAPAVVTPAVSKPPVAAIQSELVVRRSRRRLVLIARDPSLLEPYQQQNRELAHTALLERWGEDQWPSLELLWGVQANGHILESGWSHWSWGGIPQARPPEKMAAQGPDWATNPDTQIRWGLSYIAGRYGTPAAALQFRLRHHWY